MIAIDDKHFMMIEPQDPIIEEINDGMTEAAAEVFRNAKPDQAYLGFHTCVCGKHSESCDYIMPDGRITNSLLVHYVQCHRKEIPRSELAKLVVYTYTLKNKKNLTF